MQRLTNIALAFILPLLWIPLQQTSIIPDGTPNEAYLAAFPKTITLDGDTADWAGIPRVKVTTGPHPAADPATDGAVTFAVVADETMLYTLFEVTDAHIIAGQHAAEYWNEDSVELYLNATGDFGLPTYKNGVAQITLPAANIGLPVDKAVISGRQVGSLGVKAMTIKTAVGYTIEAAIPLKTDVWNIIPEHGRTIGFQVQVNSASTKDRDVKLSWSRFDTADQSYTNPSVFGKLTFYKIGESALPVNVAAAEPTRGAPAVPFSVRGPNIFDPNGSQFIAKGINVNGYNWVWTRETTQDAHLIADCWKFNVVRVNSFLLSGEQRWEQYSVNNDLDKIVNTFTDRKVVVILEAHDRIGSYYEGRDLEALVGWFTNLAQRYKSNPYVWFDVSNEPGGQHSVDRDNWVNMHQQVIHAIRDVAGADNIIIAEGMHGGQDAGTFNDPGNVPQANSAILQFANDLLSFGGKDYYNIVFSIHTYDQWTSGDAKMADFFDRVLSNNTAIIVGEYGIDGGVNTTPAVQSVFNTAVPRSIGRIAWQWDGSDKNKLTTEGGGWKIDNCTDPANLSWFGQKIWDDNHGTMPQP